MSEKKTADTPAWLPDEKHQNKFLGLLKAGASLKTNMATLFGEMVAECEECTDFEPEKAGKVVKARLIALGAETDYTDDYINRVVTEAHADWKAANGLERNAKGAGRKAEPVSYRAAQAVIALYDGLAGHGQAPGAKLLRQCSKLIGQIAAEKLTLAELKAIKPDAGKVITMPQPVAKAA